MGPSPAGPGMNGIAPRRCGGREGRAMTAGAAVSAGARMQSPGVGRRASLLA